MHVVNAEDPASPEFWSTRYAAGKTPWDLRGVPDALSAFLERSRSRGRVLIPGCGSGYEIQAFHDAGYDVTAIDFSPAAIDRARAVVGSLADRIHLGDFFISDFGAAPFDLVYERTFLCALLPSRWSDYAVRMAALLRGGGRLVGTFLYGDSADGPPFPMRDGQEQELLGNAFRLKRSDSLSPSLPVFEGMQERWQEWTRTE